MSAFRALLRQSESEKRSRGLLHTPTEIAQQPSVWKKTAALLRERRAETDSFMDRTGMSGAGDAHVLLTGAGTSEFVGNSVADLLRVRLQREVTSIPTTHLVTHARSFILPGRRYVLVSFARSGNSPESVAALRAARAAAPAIPHLVITCNEQGALAREAVADTDSLVFTLPPETNDQGLAMTSSFSTMALAAAGLTCLNRLDEFEAMVHRIGDAADRVMDQYGDLLHELAGLDTTRACFLGSGALYGAMQEASLKNQELTEGRIACIFNSYLGFRHGPQVFANGDCLVVAALASEDRVRRYELDLLREMRAKRQGRALLVLCDRRSPAIAELTPHVVELFPSGPAVEDRWRIFSDIVPCQILAVFKSLALGLQPDSPSSSGIINRVVQGVRIYDDGFEEQT